MKAYFIACICTLPVCVLYFALFLIIFDWLSHDDMHDILNENIIETHIHLYKFAIERKNQNNSSLANFVMSKDE